MKKVLKSRIFIVIITMIICISGTLYATTKYNASEVIYNPSSGDSMTVNEVLNELYDNSKTTTTKCSILCGNARIGDYVKMTPTSTSYTISKDLTGYSDDQTINPSELNLWRIIRINDDGTIEMVSENASSTNVYFKGQAGYLNFVGALNEIAKQYRNSKYTINSRIIGYGGQTEYITNTSKFTTPPAPWTYNTKDNSNEALGGGDIMYLTDTNQVTEILGSLTATTPSGTTASYWLGSRYYFYYSGVSYEWYGRYVYHGSIVDRTYSTILYGYDCSKDRSQSISNAIRPILTLKSGLTAKGTGTKDDPLVLE